MSKSRIWLASALLVASAPQAMAELNSKPQTLIPRSEIFGNPTRTSLMLSPNGRWAAYLAPKDGVMNIWVAPFGKWDQAKVVSKEQKRGIRTFIWAANGEQLIYRQDNGGDENWRLHLIDLASGSEKLLSPEGKFVARVIRLSQARKDEILISVNDRDPKFHDLYRVNLKTGDRKLMLKNEGYRDLIADDDLQLRIVSKPQAGGSFDFFRIDGDRVESKPLFSVKGEDSSITSALNLDKTGQYLYMIDTRDRDKAALQQIDLKTGEKKVLVENQKADVSTVLQDPRTDRPQAASAFYLKPEWTVIDSTIKGAIDFLNREARGQWTVSSRTDDDRFWTVAVDRVTEPVAYYLYERPTNKFTRLFTARPELEGKTLAPMHGFEITARDGTILPSYVSLPAAADADKDGKPEKALPMVLLVHGGPWARDSYGFNPEHQWLANRGLAVLSVNYRGSGGFGKVFMNKAVREFSGAMHNDLIDAVNWAVKEGIAQKDKIAIMGGSYGGYATLVGMTFTPDTFACGVDIVGPSNLVTLIENFPAYWQPYMESSWFKYAGNPKNAADRKDLLARSPLTKVDQIKRPLLIGQGANDPRVTQKESDQIVAAMKAKSIPVTYALFPDEGHGFALPQNRIAFNSVTENFLAKCLGSSAQAFGGDLKGSSLQLPEGQEHIPGLPEAYKGR